MQKFIIKPQLSINILMSRSHEGNYCNTCLCMHADCWITPCCDWQHPMFEEARHSSGCHQSFYWFILSMYNIRIGTRTIIIDNVSLDILIFGQLWSMYLLVSISVLFIRWILFNHFKTWQRFSWLGEYIQVSYSSYECNYYVKYIPKVGSI